MPAPISRTRPVTSATRAAGSIDIKPQSSDPGIKLTVKANSITLKGTASGALVKKDAFGNPASYSVARGVSFEVDKKQMPSFANEPDYTAKNKWYFAHMTSIDTTKGWSAEECANRLAKKLNAGGAYKAVVSVKGDSATIQLTKL